MLLKNIKLIKTSEGNVTNLKSTTYKEGSRPICPYCNSIQVKAMANQPKKYPEPKTYWHSNKKEVEALKKVWDHGYDCKKCGNEFIALPWTMTPSWEVSTHKQQTEKSKKKSGFFGKLIKWLIFLIIAFFALSFFLVEDDKVATPSSEKSQNGNPTTKPDSISHSQDMNDTLSIKTTIREAE